MKNIIKSLCILTLLFTPILAEHNIQNLIDSGAIKSCFAGNGELRLSYKNLQSLKGIENLPQPESITFIDLSHNQISDLSDYSLDHFPNLTQLWLNNNQLNDISQLIGHANLRELHISNNNLKMLDLQTLSIFPMLYVVNAGFNEIEQLKTFEGKLNHLEVLFLNNNKIQTLPSCAFEPCPSLQAIYLQDNLINILPSDCFKSLYNLRLLYLYSNLFTSLPTNIFSDLKNLHVLYLNNDEIQNSEKDCDAALAVQPKKVDASAPCVAQADIDKFLSIVRKEVYQDIVVDGVTIKEGVKDCEIRYPNIKKILDGYKRPFTVLDIGASEGYFSLRIAAEYDCTCIMIEGDKTLLLPQICQLNKRLDNVVVLEKFITPQDLKELGECEHFDLVLAFNVIHQMKDGWKDSIDYLLTLGDNILIETPPPGCRTAANSYTLPLIEEYLSKNKHGKVVATVPRYGRPGLPSPDQKYSNVYLFQMNKNVLQKPAWGSPNNRFYAVNSTLEQKTLYKPRIDKTITWKKGINLWTFKNMNGVYPSKDVIKNEILRLSEFPHGDFMPWNMIIQGTNLDLIDWEDNNIPAHMHKFDACWNQFESK